MDKSVFEVLSAINVNEHTEDKPTNKKDDNGKQIKLTYLSWAWAYAELMKHYPDASFEVIEWDGRPYLDDPNLGYMVMTRLTIEGQTKEMWLPVMDGNNNAMKSVPYSYETKYGKRDVAAATMMDINKAIMRCLVKNIGLFGLGLYIYAGEDLPEGAEPKSEVKVETKKEEPKPEVKVETDPNAKITEVQCGALVKRINGDKDVLDLIIKSYEVKTLNDLSVKALGQINRNWGLLVEKAHEGKAKQSVPES